MNGSDDCATYVLTIALCKLTRWHVDYRRT